MSSRNAVKVSKSRTVDYKSCVSAHFKKIRDRQYVYGSSVNFDFNVFQCTGLVSFLQKLFEFNLLFVRNFLISHP